MNSKKYTIVFVCDYNSIHARRWIEYFFQGDYNITIISTTPYNTKGCEYKLLNLAKYKPAKEKEINCIYDCINKFLSKIPFKMRLHTTFKDFSYIISFLKRINKYSKYIKSIKPDIVHAMRIQYEGLLVRFALTNGKFYLSIWGQDIVQYQRNILFTYLNKRVLSKVDTLFVDTKRDKCLAESMGLSKNSSIEVLPATGGLKLYHFAMSYNFELRQKKKEKFLINKNTLTFLSCRGFGRRYLLTNKLISAFSILIENGYNLYLIIDGNRSTPGYWELLKIIKVHNLSKNIKLLSYSHQELQEAMKSLDFYISLTLSDGTPISMLESMANGMIPVVSDLDCYKEWIKDEYNGFLVNTSSIQSIVKDILRVVGFSSYTDMIYRNFKIVKKYADWGKNLKIISEKHYKIGS